MADRDGGSCPHLPTDLFGRFREGVKRVHTILLFSAWERSSRMETARSAEPVAAVGNGADSPRREAWSFRRRHPAYPPTGRPHGRPHGRFMPLLGGHPHVALLVIRLPTHRPGANAEAAYRGRHPYGCQPEPCRKASFRSGVLPLRTGTGTRPASSTRARARTGTPRRTCSPATSASTAAPPPRKRPPSTGSRTGTTASRKSHTEGAHRRLRPTRVSSVDERRHVDQWSVPLEAQSIGRSRSRSRRRLRR